jgi:hypothetical protein
MIAHALTEEEDVQCCGKKGSTSGFPVKMERPILTGTSSVSE